MRYDANHMLAEADTVIFGKGRADSRDVLTQK